VHLHSAALGQPRIVEGIRGRGDSWERFLSVRQHASERCVPAYNRGTPKAKPKGMDIRRWDGAGIEGKGLELQDTLPVARNGQRPSDVIHQQLSCGGGKGSVV
jgi:hypothetical protein